ncbi:uncharacterized protein LOC129592863 isoform X2 [Paramacrobiotus metropolitanus]|uniref:uncharacterized protein LOC129592863 isoform X2 n=1 Tax=Paramacrobiotus metropolitanus TaxID=2943436 RepID=UPI002445F08C|nr:uncharacterized protein LOC129592863 isoform X2 [Paramacrobiotus metropolitanus]
MSTRSWRFSSCSSTLICWAQQPALCQPVWPWFILPQAGDKNIPQQIVGDWYKYRQLANGLEPLGTINQKVRWTSVAQTVDTLTNTPALAITLQFAQYNIPENKTCANHYWSGLYTEDGRLVGNVAVVEDNYVMREASYGVLYHDYNKLVVAYGCYGRNPNGTCASPVVFAQTRVSPPDLTASDKAAFDAVIDQILEPYCAKATDVPLQVYNDQPFCPFLDFPDCSNKLVEGLQLINTSSQLTGNPGAAGAPPPSACQLPNSILATTSYDPTQMAGSWYGYRFKSVEGAVSNSHLNWHVIGKSSFPLSNVTAQLMWMEYVVVSSSNTCLHGYFLGALGVNGQADGLLGPQGGDRVFFQLTTLYLDSKFALFYGCIIPDATSANCRSPYVSAVARQDASQLSAADKSSFDAIITPFFSKYGCSANDILLVGQTSNGPPCALQGFGDQCIQLNIKGLAGKVEAGSDTSTTAKPYSY